MYLIGFEQKVAHIKGKKMRDLIIKIISIFVMSMIIILMCTTPAMALNKINVKTEKVKVGFFQFDGYHNTADNGVRSGYGYDLLQKLAAYNEWDYEYIGYDKSWSEMQDMLESGEIDILTSAQKTEERIQKFDFSERAIGSSSTILTVKSGDFRYIAGDYKTYSGMRVGLLEDSSRNDSFSEFALNAGFTYTPIYFQNTTDMQKALQEGKDIDAIVTSTLRTTTDEWILEKFDTSDYYVMVRKGNTHLLSEINYALNRLDEDSPSWRTVLNNKYYAADSGDDIYFTTAERAFLQESDAQGTVFRAIVSPDRAPYSYFENGQAKGIIVEIFKNIAEQIGIKYEIIQTSSREEYNELLKNGSIDIRIDACFDYYDSESNGYKLTQPYLSTSISLITKKDFTGTVGSVAALKQADITRNYSDKLYSSNQVEYTESLQDCVNAVLSGKVDGTYAYTYAAQLAVQNDVKNRLKSSLLPDYTMDFSIAVSNKCEHRLLAVLNKGVTNIREDTVQEIVFRETDMGKSSSLIGFLYANPLWAAFIIVSFAVCVFVILLLLVRAKASKRQRQQESILARFMGYVCQANDMVLEVDLSKMICTRYFLDNGKVQANVEQYHNLNYDNYNETICPADFSELVQHLTEEKMDQMINSGGGDEYFECRAKTQNGQYEWFSYTIRAIKKDPTHPRNFILFKKNINEVKCEEEAKKQVLTDALETARQASEAKGVFLSRMSHEIRTPLNAVIGYMTIAKMSQDKPDKVNHCIENSETAAKHLLNIINDVLDISSIESGRIKIADEDFDLKKLISSVSTMFYNQCKAKNVNFNVALYGLTEEWVVGDQLRVNQILMNLLSNAVKFTSAGGSVNLDVTQMMISNNNVHIKFQIRDTGIGMSKEYMSRMFTPFEQESAGTAQKFGGTGLGLSITKNLITMMGGSIDVFSKQEKGTEFTLTLTFRQSNENMQRHSLQHDFSKVRALVVDDEKNTCDYIKALLKRCGVKSDIVFNGEDAVKQVKRRQGSDYSYDLCIMDWNMPGLDGIETARRIHEECSKDLPIIIATAYDISDIEDSAKKAGVTKIISKPLFQSTLFDLLVSTYGKYQPEIPTDLQKIDMRGMRVILAEDNAMNLEIAVEVLEHAGLTVDTAMNGKEALDMFTVSSPDTYQAILMDIQMPVMDGYEAARKIRQSSHSQAKSIAIIAMTANAFSEDVSEALASGMNDHISKPIDYSKLFSALNKNVKDGVNAE